MNTKCTCGGTMGSAMLVNFNLKPYLGIVVMAKSLVGYRCDQCGFEAIDGEQMMRVAAQTATLIVALPQRLSREHAQYLRKYLDLTQKELAERMGITRKTVSEWESKGGRISPQNDLILRTLAFAKLSAAERSLSPLRELAQKISHVRTAAPRASRTPLELEGLDATTAKAG